MPSPIAHLAVGYAIYRLNRKHEPQPALKPVGRVPGLLVVTAVFSLLPDIDSALGFLTGNFGRFHNNATHSLIVGVFFSCVLAVLMWWWGRQGFHYWFGIALGSYTLHIVMDAATVSRGVMAFWPLTDTRYLFPVTLFYGLHWSDGWLSIRHLWTLLTELLFLALVMGLLRFQPQQAEARS